MFTTVKPSLHLSAIGRKTLVLFLLTTMHPAHAAECVEVKYRGAIPIKTFDCRTVTDSSLVNSMCYDQAAAYMLIELAGTYYHYCLIEPVTVERLLEAPSKDQFYHQNIRGNYDCRIHPAPPYPVCS